MHEFPVHKVPDNFRDAHITPERYDAMYRQSIEEPDTFWAERTAACSTWRRTASTGTCRGAPTR